MDPEKYTFFILATALKELLYHKSLKIFICCKGSNIKEYRTLIDFRFIKAMAN